jgi:hypothetical protein
VIKLNIAANLKELTVHTLVLKIIDLYFSNGALLTHTFQIPPFISAVEAYYIEAIIKGKS